MLLISTGEDRHVISAYLQLIEEVVDNRRLHLEHFLEAEKARLGDEGRALGSLGLSQLSRSWIENYRCELASVIQELRHRDTPSPVCIDEQIRAVIYLVLASRILAQGNRS